MEMETSYRFSLPPSTYKARRALWDLPYLGPLPPNIKNGYDPFLHQEADVSASPSPMSNVDVDVDIDNLTSSVAALELVKVKAEAVRTWVIGVENAPGADKQLLDGYYQKTVRRSTFDDRRRRDETKQQEPVRRSREVIFKADKLDLQITIKTSPRPVNHDQCALDARISSGHDDRGPKRTDNSTPSNGGIPLDNYGRWEQVDIDSDRGWDRRKDRRDGSRGKRPK